MRNIIYLVVLFSVSFFLISYFGIFQSAQRIEELKTDIISQKINNEKNINKQYNMAELKGKMQKKEMDIQKINTIFVDKSINEGIDFIEAMDKLGEQNNVNADLVMNNSAPKPDNELYKITTINIKATGAYRNIIRYLLDLEKMKFYININSLSIKKIQGAETVSLELNANTYWK